MTTRTPITVNTITANATTALPTPTTADTTNDHSLTLPAGACLEEIILLVKQTAATTSTITVKAGDSPPADAAGQGDLTKAIVQNATWLVGPLTSARFIQDDGTLNVDLDATFTGEITALWVPRTA